MESSVAGIETADYEVVEVTHDLASLTELFSGASVVLNTVGPFSKWGHEVVEACRPPGPTTPTPPVSRTGRSPRRAVRRGLRRRRPAPRSGIAQMYTTGEIAAELALEAPGLDTLDIAVFWGGSPTIASTQTILFNAALSGAHYLEQNTYVPFDPEAGHYQLAIPGQHELALALPWGGTSHPVWYRKDPRVANCKALGGVLNRPSARRTADRRRGDRGDQGHGARREVRRPGGNGGPGDEHDAARENPG